MEENKNEKTKIFVVSIIFFIAIFFGVYLVDSKINNKSDNNNLEQNVGENINKVPEQNDKDEFDKDDTLENGPNEENKPLEKVEAENNDVSIPNALKGNSLEDFDLTFLKIENQKSNKIYSPISIKYALGMLEEGADGNSKQQISNLIGNYNLKKYTNNDNMSFANALFIKDSYKDSIKNSYINTLSSKYNADIIYDSFITANNLNNWVSNKTFKLIDNLFEDVSNNDFILVNALAIDMEWKNKIQGYYDYFVGYAHRDYYKRVSGLITGGYSALDFGASSFEAKTVEIGAVINKYDIVNVLGENNIRTTVESEYRNWLSKGAPNGCGSVSEQLDVDTYVNNYMKEIKEGYNDISSSTDFYFYTDDNVKVFAKDLKEYNGVTLQYVGIMPTKESLKTYIQNVDALGINNLINNLKTVELKNFKEGVITEITGYIPLFKFDYKLELQRDLKKLGITDVFDASKANLSNLVTNGAYISDTTHKANIEFSNEGIKAAAAVSSGGAGAGECGFDYIYKVPVEKIDLTFDNPYLFLIRDKNTGEVWFTGTVYQPLKYKFEWNN